MIAFMFIANIFAYPIYILLGFIVSQGFKKRDAEFKKVNKEMSRNFLKTIFMLLAAQIFGVLIMFVARAMDSKIFGIMGFWSVLLLPALYVLYVLTRFVFWAIKILKEVEWWRNSEIRKKLEWYLAKEGLIFASIHLIACIFWGIIALDVKIFDFYIMLRIGTWCYSIPTVIVFIYLMYMVINSFNHIIKDIRERHITYDGIQETQVDKTLSERQKKRFIQYLLVNCFLIVSVTLLSKWVTSVGKETAGDFVLIYINLASFIWLFMLIGFLRCMHSVVKTIYEKSAMMLILCYSGIFLGIILGSIIGCIPPVVILFRLRQIEAS